MDYSEFYILSCQIGTLVYSQTILGMSHWWIKHSSLWIYIYSQLSNTLSSLSWQFLVKWRSNRSFSHFSSKSLDSSLKTVIHYMSLFVLLFILLNKINCHNVFLSMNYIITDTKILSQPLSQRAQHSHAKLLRYPNIPGLVSHFNFLDMFSETLSGTSYNLHWGRVS